MSVQFFSFFFSSRSICELWNLGFLMDGWMKERKRSTMYVLVQYIHVWEMKMTSLKFCFLYVHTQHYTYINLIRFLHY